MKSRVVLIHIGNFPPEHFWRNVQHLKTYHPTIGIDLILDHDVSIQLDQQIRAFNYKSDPKLLEFLKKQQNESSFRNGFWRYSTERLFALAEHAISNPEYSYIHIESDVLILPQFPFEEFEKLENIYWSRYDNLRDLASIVFIPGPEESEWFLQMMHEMISEHSDINDMILLNRIARQFPERIQCLPTAPKTNSKLICDRYVGDQIERLRISENFSVFFGVFDSAALGIWLTGTEPRNYFGVKKKYSTKDLLRTPTYVNPSKTVYTYRKGEGLFLDEDGIEIPVFNLHVHSKDLELFGPNWEESLRQIVDQSRSNRVQIDFSHRILLQLIRENFEKGTILSFVFWLPGLRQFRRLSSFKKLTFLR